MKCYTSLIASLGRKALVAFDLTRMVAALQVVIVRNAAATEVAIIQVTVE